MNLRQRKIQTLGTPAIPTLPLFCHVIYNTVGLLQATVLTPLRSVNVWDAFHMHAKAVAVY